jgi:hypothetical protein
MLISIAFCFLFHKFDDKKINPLNKYIFFIGCLVLFLGAKSTLAQAQKDNHRKF